MRAEVFGSLALTGRGHGTDKAVLMGLEGHWPNAIDPDIIPATLARIRGEKKIRLLGRHEIAFDEKHDLIMNKRQKLPFHTNGMRFTAYDAAGKEIATRDYYSVGGGFVVNQDEAAEDRIVADTTELRHPFNSGAALLRADANAAGSASPQLMFDNERHWRSDDEIRDGLRDIWNAMQACVQRGIRETGTLPGGLHVVRRAPSLHAELSSKPEAAMRDPLTVLDWVNLYALAVNEENAAGGRVVTAPTNGAAGIIPSVLHYYDRFCAGRERTGRLRFPAHRIGHRHPLQGKRLDLRRRSRLPGRSRRRLLDGRRRPDRRARRHRRADRECRRNRHGTQPRPDLRPDRRPRADSRASNAMRWAR